MTNSSNSIILPAPNTDRRDVSRRSLDARDAAWLALERVADGRAERLTDVIDSCGLDARDAALGREIALGVARNQRLYEHLARGFLKPGRQPVELLRALAIGAHQLFALDQIPPHAACSTTVELLHNHGAKGLTGVTNAVMRRFAELRMAQRQSEGPLGRIPPERWPDDLAVLASLPDALVADLRAELVDHPRERLLALNNVVPLCTRTRPGCAPPTGQGIRRQEGDWTWWDDPQAAIQGPVADGRCLVQDRAQGHVVDLSGARPGELVLDLCAAPGGKSLAFADRGCRVVAADNNPRRMPRLRANLKSQATMLLQDGLHTALAPGSFDVVLVDAPCSNSGVLGRRPEARWRYQPKTLAQLATLQRRLLLAAAELVRPDGRLIYSTCSVTPSENQGIAHRLDGWRILKEQRSWPDAWQAGGYVAVLVRIDSH
jgi:16S rRNA (cytosine967-C5)-methyltransferase